MQSGGAAAVMFPTTFCGPCGAIIAALHVLSQDVAATRNEPLMNDPAKHETESRKGQVSKRRYGCGVGLMEAMCDLRSHKQSVILV